MINYFSITTHPKDKTKLLKVSKDEDKEKKKRVKGCKKSIWVKWRL